VVSLTLVWQIPEIENARHFRNWPALRILSGVLNCLSDRSSLECRGIASSIHEPITERSGGCPGPAARSAVAGDLAGNVRGNFRAWADRI